MTSKYLQVLADKRNATMARERLDQQRDDDVGERTCWFVREEKLVLLPMKDTTGEERDHIMATLFHEDLSTPREQHERLSKLAGGYIAFVAALLVATFANSKEYSRAWIVISLLAVSLPSLIAYVLLDFIVRARQMRNKSGVRSLAAGLGILPSLLGIAVLIGHFSVIAAVLFGLITLFWGVAFDVVAYLGRYPGSDI